MAQIGAALAGIGSVSPCQELGELFLKLSS